MEFSRQEYWRGLPFPSSGDLPDPGTEPGTPVLQVDSLLSESLGKPQVGGGGELIYKRYSSIGPVLSFNFVDN